MIIRALYYFCFVPIIRCTFDMNEQQVSYIASHLSTQECYKLIAALHNLSYNLPRKLTIPKTDTKTVSCKNLLTDYCNGKEPWEGGNKSHEVIAHRLRQIGRHDLADWLGIEVFYHLARGINDSLLKNPFVEIRPQSALNSKLQQDKDTATNAEWDVIDIALWVVLASLLTSVVFSCCRLLWLSCRNKGQSTNEEMKVLLGQEHRSACEHDF